jgi:Ran GTPase-activating protein (RanGAP) involved in mRNA processing and transport
MGDEGASALADALKVSTSLSNINLRGNGIGAEGASALADALKVNKSVTRINLF